jgi:tetratricopeptide (TPR) repeat protein
MSQELAQSDPSNYQARRNLAVAHGRLGGVLDRMGDSVGALQNYEKALEVQQKMASDNPDNAQARRELSVVYEDLGRHFAAGNNVAGATANYQKALAIRTQLSQEDPKNAQAARDLAFIEMNTGEMQEQTNQRAGAVESYRRALAIFQRLAAQDPSNLLARRDLALIFERLGNLQAGAGNATAALEHYRRLQELASEWASKDGSTVALHTLGVAHLKVSEMQSRANDRAAALTSSEAALNIFQKLHQKDQSNTENQRGLAWAWIRKGEALTSSSQKAIEAGKCYQQSLTLLADLEKRGLLRPADATLQKNVQAAISQISRP